MTTDDPLLNTPPATPEPAGRKRIACDFCGCSLAPNGDVMAMSDKARRFRDLSEKNDQLEAELSKARTEVADLTAKLNAYPTPAAEKKLGRLLL